LDRLDRIVPRSRDSVDGDAGPIARVATQHVELVIHYVFPAGAIVRAVIGIVHVQRGEDRGGVTSVRTRA
jgi:hypothetical protein